MHMFLNAPNRGPRKIQKIWLGDIIDDRDKVHVIIMPDYSALELESFVDRLYCQTSVPPDDPTSTSNNHHGIEGDEVKDEVYDDYSSDEAILCPQCGLQFASRKALTQHKYHVHQLKSSV